MAGEAKERVAGKAPGRRGRLLAAVVLAIGVAGVVALVLSREEEAPRTERIDPVQRIRARIVQAEDAKARVYAPGALAAARQTLEAALSAPPERQAELLRRAEEEIDKALMTARARASDAAEAAAEARGKDRAKAEMVARERERRLAEIGTEERRRAPLPEGVGIVRPAEVQARRERGEDLLLLDVRSEFLFRPRHALGAAAAPLNQIPHRNYPRGVDLILYGEHAEAVEVAGAAKLLLSRGYDRIFSLAGGLEAWAAAGLPVDEVDGALPSRGGAPGIEVDELARLLHEAARHPEIGVVVVDVRQAALHRAGRIPGARSAPLKRLKEEAGLVPRGRRIVVYSASDDTSRYAARWLLAMGYADVKMLLGGIQAWAAAGNRLDAATPAARPR